MKAKFIDWWQKNKTRAIVGVIIALLVLALIRVGYLIDATGFNGYHTVTTATSHSSTSPATVTKTEVEVPAKSFWDWLQLLIIPAVLAVGGYAFNFTVSRNEQRIALDNQRETALKEYIDGISELLLEKNLSDSAEDAEVRKIARVRTLTVLSKLDASRKRSVMQFLYESDLIYKPDPSSETECIVHLHATDRDRSNGADLSGADLSGLSLGFSDLHLVNLRNANLRKANLSEADLSGAVLSGANLREARLSWGKLVIDPTGTNLEGADLSEADLSSAIMNDVILIEADLSGANLKGATGITNEELEKQANSLKGATMPDGSPHP